MRALPPFVPRVAIQTFKFLSMPRRSIIEARRSRYKFRYLDLQKAATIAEMAVKEVVRVCRADCRRMRLCQAHERIAPLNE